MPVNRQTSDAQFILPTLHQGRLPDLGKVLSVHVGRNKVPEVVHRTSHEEMHRAVPQVYGQVDIRVRPFWTATEEETAALQTSEDEVIESLFLLGEERPKRDKALTREVKKGGEAVSAGESGLAKAKSSTKAKKGAPPEGRGSLI